MNYTFTREVGNGVTRVYAFSFAGADNGYIDLSRDLRVLVGGVPVAFTTRRQDPNKVTLNTAPPVGAEVLIRRVMPSNLPYSDFKTGNAFNKDTVNRSFLQQLYLTQELLDGFLPDGFYWKQDLNMGGHKVINMANGENPGDATNYQQLHDIDVKHSVWNTQQDAEINALKEGIVSNVGIRTIPWLHTGVGGEDTISPPFKFSSAWVWRQGIMQYQLAGAFEIVDNTIMLAEPLETGEEVLIAMGSGAAAPDDHPSFEDVLGMLEVFKGQLADGNGGLVGYTDVAGKHSSLQTYLDNGYIRVSSREELLAALLYINTIRKSSTEVRLNRVFAPWSAPQTDLDVTWASIVGEGQATRISCSGIPNVDGNYAAKLYSTSSANIGNLPYLTGDKLKNVMFLGPGGAGVLVDGVILESTGTGRTSLGGFAIHGSTISGFREGLVVGQNAYIIHIYHSRVARCLVHLHMKQSGNSGEGVVFYGGAMDTSAGVCILNDNPNGAVRCFGTSLDYTGGVAWSNRGSIELYGCHMEFENGVNNLNRIPYHTSAAQDSRILIHGGEILTLRGLNPLSQPAVFESLAGGIGIYLQDVKMSFLITSSGKLKQGDGVFSSKNAMLLDGNGNPAISRLQEQVDNVVPSGYNTTSSVANWFIQLAATDTVPPTDRLTSATGSMSLDNAVFPSGSAGSIKISKVVGNGARFSLRCAIPVESFAQVIGRLSLMSSAGTTGACSASFQFGSVSHYDSLLRPVLSQLATGTVSNFNLTDLQGAFTNVNAFGGRNPVPRWATHYILTLNLIGMSAGGVLYLGATEVFTM